MGVYNKECTNKENEHIYFGQLDMNVKSYVKGDKQGFQISTLDHKKVNNCNEGIQKDGTSCGCWTILDMLNRTKICTKTLTMDTPLKVENVRLTIFTVVMQIYKFLCKSNNFEKEN